MSFVMYRKHACIWLFVFAFGISSCGHYQPKYKFIHKTHPTGKRDEAEQKNPDSFSEVGFASWYGNKFARKKTASGERFNPQKLTAAHKTLPFGTFVEVTNLSNGKTVVVKINDRGPFIKNRIIDLSRFAARQIDMVGPGKAMVEVKPIYQ